MTDVKMSHEMLQETPRIVVLSIDGKGDYNNGREIEAYFHNMLQNDNPRHVILDLARMEYAGSSFLGTMMFWREAMVNQGGALVLYGLQPHVASVLRISGLDRILKICPDQDAALASLLK